jgi:RHS repeat-associated protein
MNKRNKLLFFLVSCLLLSGIGSYLKGQSGVFDRVGVIPGHGTYSSLPIESVDLFTGNLTLRYRDIYLPGPNGLDVEIWRVYNSKILKDRQSGQAASVQAYHKSWVGIGWTMHMGMVHQYTSNTPVIEFPDGRRETAYLDNYGVGKHITREFLKYDKPANKLYLKNGVIWTFGAIATITLADGTSDPVRLVTKIENAYGHSINIYYNSGTPTISYILDAMQRQITFVTSGSPKKLTQVKIKNFDGSHDVVSSYSVDAFSDGYYRLASFTPPGLPATTFEYFDGSSNRYELTKLTTSYGGMLEYSYLNHDFYFNSTYLDSIVVSQKKITFNAGEQAKVWNYTYPDYNGVTSGTATVQGPEFTTNVTHCAYDAAYPWKIGLMTAGTVSDGSYSETSDWTYQEISNQTWTVLGTNMGTAKGPLLANVIKSPTGDATLKEEYIYEPGETMKYGCPRRIKYYVNGSATAKSYKEFTYTYETVQGFKNRYMLAFINLETHYSGTGTVLKSTQNVYYQESGKWGALDNVIKRRSAGSYLNWDYEYASSSPSYIAIHIDPPGKTEKFFYGYSYGVKNQVDAPGFTQVTRTISSHNSSVLMERTQDGAEIHFQYDDLGRTTLVDMPGYYNDFNYTWRPSGENRVDITQGENTVTRYWDGMGRDTGYTELGDGTTLYFRRTLDAEGRVKDENQGSTNVAHKYSYAYNAAGQVTQITDPMSEVTTISYQGITKTVTDPESHGTAFECNDLPGLPTKVTDAQGHVANYTYDPIGRLITVVYNGTREHHYEYDGLDNVTSESHPETGAITYTYNSENLLGQKTWGGVSLQYEYNTSNQLTSTTTGDETIYYAYNTLGRIQSTTSSNGWSRSGILYSIFGKLTKEVVTIPGLSPKQVEYLYDWNNNLKEITYPDGKVATITSNGLNMPESLSFGGHSLVSNASYGPGKMLAAMTLGNGTIFAATFNNSGLFDTVSLTKDSATLYDASYAYDGTGNITGISSMAPSPSLSATFGYDSLNRLTSATYTSGRVGTYSYDYDEYGNMRTARENGAVVFDKTYYASNRIIGNSYDARGNLTSANGKFYFWGNQNRLNYVSNTSGEVLGKYLYDDRGLRLRAIPPLPEIEVVGIPDGGSAEFNANLGSPQDVTFTIRNLGDANLVLSGSPAITITGPNADQFSVQQQPTSPVTPAGSTTFIIRFAPSSQGNKTAAISIANNDIDESSYDITLKGYCGSQIAVLGTPNGGTFDFGTVHIGDYWQETFTIENTGAADLIISGFEISGEDEGGFNIVQQPSSPVQPGGTSTFIIRFTARNPEGQKMATLSIENNDLDENPYIITLVGVAEPGPGKAPDESPIVVTSPNGGEEIEAASLQSITWTGNGAANSVKIEYSTDNGTTYRTIAERAPNVGSYSWLVPKYISPSCLIRISDTEGAPTVPALISYEFNFKVSKFAATGKEAADLVIQVGVPDAKTQSWRAAAISFSADELQRSEKMLFNSVEIGSQDLDVFLEKWHHLRVEFDMNNYAGSVCLDGQPIMENVPLMNSPLVTNLTPEISVSGGADGSSKVWVEDFAVKLLDQNPKLGNEGEVPEAKPILRDSFDRYKNGDFPERGGWRIRQEAVSEDKASSKASKVQVDGERRSLTSSKKAAQASVSSRIDDTQFVSSPNSFKLESSDGGPVSIVKRFSLPVRTPYDTSDGNFSITPEGFGSQGVRVATTLGEHQRGSRRGTKRAERENRAPSRQSRATSGEQTPSSYQAPIVRTPDPRTSRGKGTLKTSFSASPVGTYYIYSFDGRLLAEYSPYNQCVRDYLYMGNRLVAEYQPLEAKYYYYTPDQINSTRIVTNDAGAVVYAAAHDPYGAIQQTWVNTYDPTPKFSGKERDAESGLDYFGARYYDRSQYRFISVDPIINPETFLQSPQRMNLFSYCAANPISFMDPNGKAIIPVGLPGVNGVINTFLNTNFSVCVNGFIQLCSSWGINIQVTSAYRSPAYENVLAQTNPLAQGVQYSLHSCGLAIDINWNGIAAQDRDWVLWAAEQAGLSWGGTFTPPDPVHFYQNPPTDRATAVWAASIQVNYWNWGVSGLLDFELYMLYGVFTEKAAWQVVVYAQSVI